MFRTILCCVVMLALCVGCKGKNDNKAKEATITKVDAKKGTAAVKMQSDGKDVDKTFKLAERIEYMDSAGDVATADIFTSGDRVLIFESDGTITKMKNKDKTRSSQSCRTARTKPTRKPRSPTRPSSGRPTRSTWRR